MDYRPRKTLADFLVIGITPLLIMVMVASVAFFVVEIIHTGAYHDRLKWSMFWFVVASVLVSRISIEQGQSKAAVYGLGLGCAMSVFIFRLYGPAWGALALLAFIWWCTGKLTWDCTLIDDDQDASGQGLLQAAKLEGKATAEAATDPAKPKATKRRKPQNQPHSPGMWVVYFALLALPAYGIGQALLPASRPELKTYGFQLLCAFMAAALALLLATSFLGLRRYLRQRYLQMPGTVAATWITMGAIIAAGVLLAALLLPRPDASWSVTAMIDKAQEAAEQASKYAMVGGEAGENEGRRIGEGKDGDESKKEGEEKKNGAAGGEGKETNSLSKATEKGPQSGSSPQSAEQGKTQPDATKDGKSDSKEFGGENPPKPPEMDEKASKIGLLVKLALYALLIGAILWLVIWQRKRIAKFLGAWAHEFMAFWKSLFGRKQASAKPASPTAPSRPFSQFINPFASGTARDMSTAEALGYTYAALEAWAIQHGMERHEDQTPNEFAAVLSMQFPASAEELSQTARHYSRLVYADRQPPEELRDDLATLWAFLETRRAGV